MKLVLDALRAPSQDWRVQLVPRREMSRAEYFEFVCANPEMRIERTAEGELIILPPAHSWTGSRNAELVRQIGNWTRDDGTGSGFDSSAGFDLPCGSNRAPDVAWVRNSRIDALTPEEQADYYPLCPDFVIELRSDSDRLKQLRDKMVEYIDDGALLGLLVDPIERRVHIYRPGRPVEILDEPASVGCDPELPGLVLDLTRVWK